jgi:cytosine/adenosine deaminase-related metal-dependent hydrolase
MSERHEAIPRTAGTSRRGFLKSGAGLVAGSAAAQTFSGAASAQGAGDAELVRLQGARRILIKGPVLITGDAQVGDFTEADLLIEDGKIREVRPEIVASGDIAVVNGGNRIVIPGFVDTHNHSYQGLMRSIMPNGVLDPDYNRDVQSKLSPAFAPPEVHAGVLMTALGMIDMGVTTIVDLSQISHTPEHSDACVRALQESGIRAVFAFSRGNPATTQYPQDIGRLARTYFSSKDQLLTLAMGAGLDPKIFAVAREADVPAVLHLVAANTSPTFLELGRAGLLRPGDEYIHCLNLTDEAWNLIKDSGGNVSQCAQIDMAMGHGTPSIQQALDRGLRPSLSSDHPVTIAQDFFTVMRHTFTFQRSQIFARARAGERNLPPLMTCRDALEFATIAGARCANLDRKIGTLTPGKDADLLMLRIDDPNLWPVNNARGTVVNMMNPGHVDAVFIAGKVRKWHGKLVGVDMARTMRLVTESRDSLWRRAGHSVDFMA